VKKQFCQTDTELILSMVKSFIDSCSATSSSKDKKAILEKYDDELFKEILHYVYNPYYIFNVTSKTVKKFNKKISPIEYSSLILLLDDLRNRQITGDIAAASVKSFVEKHSLSFSDTIYRILDKNLKCGASASTINSVFSGLIPEFNVALAYNYDDHVSRVDFEKDRWYASRKLDGVRCIARKENGVVTFSSREGISFETLGVIKCQLEGINIDNFVLDGELCLIDDFGCDDFQGVMKVIKKKNYTIPNPKYKLFDCLMLSEFDSGCSKRILSERWDDTCPDEISGFRIFDFENDNISVLEQHLIVNNNNLQMHRDLAIEKGWEGLILRKDCEYKGKKSNHLLKVKQFKDAEYIVKGIVAGDYTYTDKSKAVCTVHGVLSLIIDHNGVQVGVGSGLSVGDRISWAKNPDLIVGKVVTVKYFEETLNDKGEVSLRFPTLKIVHGEERNT